MAKDKKKGNTRIPTIASNTVTARITKSLNKKGRIKGKTKEETKLLKAVCNGHKLNKKGKVRAIIVNRGDGYCECACGTVFPAAPYKKEEVKDMIQPLKELLHQGRFMCEAAGIDTATQQYFADTSIRIEKLPKIYNRVKKVVEKNDNNKKNKKNKKNKGYNYDSDALAAWKVK